MTQQPFTSPGAPSTPPKEALDTQSQSGAVPRSEAALAPPPTGDDIKPGAPLPDEAFSSSNQVPPPGLDDGWIPEVLQNKSCVVVIISLSFFLLFSFFTIDLLTNRAILTRTTDLHPLLTNPSLLTALVQTHPAHTSAQSHLQTLLASNTALASRTRDLETHLGALRETTDALALHHGSLELAWRRKQAEMDAALAPWSPKALYQRLSAAVAEQEAVCAAVEESFLEDAGGGAAAAEVGARREDDASGGGPAGQASEREVVEWVKRVRSEGAKLEARREAKARWDEGRVGGWR